jgi:hypothetical protein
MIGLVAGLAIIGIITALMLRPEPCGDCEDAVGENDISRPGFPMADAIPVNQAYADGKHYIAGILTLPDPCYEIDSEVVIRESYPEQVDINLTTPRSGDPCATVLTDKAFEVEFEASEDAEINAFLNGSAVELLESGKGE